MSGAQPFIRPDDAHNSELVAQTHPRDWVNPTPSGRYNLVVVGAGTAGLSAAGSCAALGGRVALIERALLGGDCLVSGCVPSKAVIRAARVAADIRSAERFGIRVPEPQIDSAQVMERMRRIRAQISQHDAVRQMADAGVDVFLGEATFVGPDCVDVAGTTLKFARAVIATGGRPRIPSIQGLEASGFDTNETVFEWTELPGRVAVIGAGPIGCELAQAFCRLGVSVALIHNKGHILDREDADAAEQVQRQFSDDGVELILDATVLSVEKSGDERVLVVERRGEKSKVVADRIVVSTGRAPNTEGLGLERAGVGYDANGIKVNDGLQTSNPRIYAAGDIESSFKFTHTANALGRMAMVNALLFGRGRASRMHVPWCTYTDPEVAHVGLYEREAEQKGLKVDTLTVSFGENDRAVLDGEENGFVRVHLSKGGDKIEGATVVSRHAGDLISYFTLAMNQGRGLGSLARAIYPYPTQAEIIRQLAGKHLQTRLRPWMKTLTAKLMDWKR